MGIGSSLLNWGILAVGIILFGIGQLYFSFYARAYKRHVLRYGRVQVGREYGTSWTKQDEGGLVFGRIMWTIAPTIVTGVLLFFLTGLPKIGVPLWLGCTLGIGGLFSIYFAFSSGAGLAKREVEIALRHKPEEEQKEK